MGESRPALFRGRHFREEIIVLCLRWYLRYPLSYRNLEEMMAERGLSVDHSTIARWVLHYAPILNKRIQRRMRNRNRSWRVDETYIRVPGRWTYLYRAIDSDGNTIDFRLSLKRDYTAAKTFLRLALSRAGAIRPRVINVDGHASYPRVIKELKRTGELGCQCASSPLPSFSFIISSSTNTPYNTSRNILFAISILQPDVADVIGWNGILMVGSLDLNAAPMEGGPITIVQLRPWTHDES